MDQLVAVDRSNWKVVFRSNDNRIILYNPNSHELRTSRSSTPHSEQWSSLSYFEILEYYLMLHMNRKQLPPPLSEFLLDGYFSKYFTIQKKIGSGGAGSVYHVKHQLAGYRLAEYAVKIVPIGVFSRLKSALSEVRFLQKLSLSHHPFILGYNHCWIENYQPAFFGPKIPCLFILMEYSKYGNLENFLTKNKNLSFKAKWQIFIQILLALNLLHNDKIIHRDLKMSNILVFDSGNNKNPLHYKFVLSDFGTAISEEGQIITPASERTGATGTIETMAPELLEQNEEGKFIHVHSFSSDIWSLGVIFFTIFIGKNPFISENGEELLRNFTNVDNLLNKLGIYHTDIPNDILSLLRKMMVRRSYLRINIKDILKNPTVKHYINEFNYNSLNLSASPSFSNLSQNESNSNLNSNSSLIPINSHSIYRENNPSVQIIETTKFTDDEFHRSIPLAITYTPNFKKDKNICKNIKTEFKFYIILFITLACVQFPNCIFYLLHLALSFSILFISKSAIYVLYSLPLLIGIEALIFPSNSFMMPLLVLILIIFIIGQEN